LNQGRRVEVQDLLLDLMKAEKEEATFEGKCYEIF